MPRPGDHLLSGKRSDAISVAVVTAHVALVLTPAYLAVIWEPGPHFILLWMWLGLTMNGLLNLMHECAHYHVFKPRWGSNALSRWVLAPLMGVSFDGYRHLHWEHHRHLGEEGDPKYSYLENVRGWRLAALLLRCLLLVEALRKFRYQAGGARRAAGSAQGSKLWVGRVFLLQAVFFGSLWAVSSWFASREFRETLVLTLLAYATVYIYGLMSLTLFLATLRAIAEHQPGIEQSLPAGHASLRNLKCNPVSRLLLGCYGFAEHATHHREPGIPYYNLARATTELAAIDPALTPRQGYVSTILTLVNRPDPAHNGKDLASASG
jgi:fatty acid desaturase